MQKTLRDRVYFLILKIPEWFFLQCTQGSPPAADYVGCEAGRRTCSKHETGKEELCEIKRDYHIVGTTA
jgi:hypothetical protein